MIKVNVQLPVEYYNILSMFGTMDEVTAKALELCENGEILLETLPPVYADETSKTFQVVINNNYYENLREIYGPTSPKVSIRKLLCYIVENEVYTDYKWPVVRLYDEQTLKKIKAYKLDTIGKTAKIIPLIKDKDIARELSNFITVLGKL